MITDLSSFITFVQNILNTNPWGCTSYQLSRTDPFGSRKGPGVLFRMIYENTETKNIGQISVKAPTAAGFNIKVSTIVGTAALITAMGGFRCHDSNRAISCQDTALLL